VILKSYLFSQISGNYQQYMADQSEIFLRQLCKNCSAPNQIAVHRDGNLMYYAYVYQKSKSEIYGLCAVCGEICLNLQWLYEFFQKTLEASANKGVLFCYDEYGKIRKNVDNFFSEVAEIDQIFRDIREYLNKYQSCWGILPPEDFLIPLDSKISFAFNEDSKDKITDAIRHYHNVIVTMDNVVLSSFSKTVERLNSEKNQLREEKETLDKKIESLAKQKKQYKWVITLSILVVLGMIAILLFNQNVNELRNEVWSKGCSIDSLNSVVSNMDSIIHVQKQEIQDTHKKLREINEDLHETKSLLSDISLYAPISASDLEVKNANGSYGENIYSSQTTYIYPRLTVYSLIEESIDLYVKFYRPDGSLSKSSSSTWYSYKDEVSLSKNQSTTVYLSGWGGKDKGHWSSGTYRIEIWYNDACIKAKTFRIY